MDAELQLQVSLGIEDARLDELDELALALRRELNREFGLDARPVAGGEAPANAKGDAFSVGLLAIAVLPTFLPKLVDFFQQWLARGQSRSMRIKIADGDKVVELEVTNANVPLEQLALFAQEQSARLVKNH
jgi:hypothetical protein